MILKFLKSGYQRLASALSKTRSFFSQKIRGLFSKPFDEQTFEELEQALYEADLGVQTAHELKEKLKLRWKKTPHLKAEEWVEILKQEILSSLKNSLKPPLSSSVPQSDEPFVIFIVGVNGNGKTTTVAKLSQHFKEQGKKVLIAAADTFRAAAVEQLDVWAKRAGADLVKGSAKADPAAVAFDALTAAKARGAQVVLIDTAGRLHTKTPLMQELEKIRRVCRKVVPTAPHETWLVIDATIGQNAIDQAKIFHQYTPLSGLILTKMDGHAKGGIVIQIQQQLGVPVKFIGVGEGIDDLEPFDAEPFVNALFDE